MYVCIYMYIYILGIGSSEFISSICNPTVGFRWSISPAPAASQNENDSVEMVKWLDMTCDNMIYPLVNVYITENNHV